MKADIFCWIWTGYGDNSAPPIAGKLYLPSNGFFRPEPPIKWRRYVFYTNGFLAVLKPRSHHAEFVCELCDPEAQNKLLAYVDKGISELFSLQDRMKNNTRRI